VPPYQKLPNIQKYGKAAQRKKESPLKTKGKRKNG